MYEELVYVGVGFSCISIFPQLWQTYQSKLVRDLSPYFLATQATSEGLFLFYSYWNHQWMMFASALLPGIGTFLLCGLYCRYHQTDTDES